MPDKIPLTPVESTAMHAAGYDPDTLTLAIQFKSGEIWHYPGVRPEIAKRFEAAESKGLFFVGNIKGKYLGAEKMTGPCPACGDRGWIGDVCTDCGTQHYVRETTP